MKFKNFNAGFLKGAFSYLLMTTKNDFHSCVFIAIEESSES